MPHNRGVHRGLAGNVQGPLLHWLLHGQDLAGHQRVGELLWRLPRTPGMIRFEQLPHSLDRFYAGKNIGKQLVKNN